MARVAHVIIATLKVPGVICEVNDDLVCRPARQDAGFAIRLRSLHLRLA